MRVLVPITGDEVTYGSGNPDNPIRPLNIRELLPESLKRFSWRAIEYDFDKGVVKIELYFKKVDKPTKWDAEGREIEHIKETDVAFAKRQTDTANAITSILRTHTIGELHQLTGEPKLMRPFKGVA